MAPRPSSHGPPTPRARGGWDVRTRALGLWRVMRANPLTLAGFLLVSVILAVAFLIEAVPLVTGLFGPPASILPYSPSAYFTAGQPPSLAHPFGTDNLGRDMLARVLAALPLDLAIGFSVAGVALLVGGSLGLVAGYWDRPGSVGGVLSIVILRVTDVFLAFPSLVLALALTAALGRGTVQAVAAIMITWWPYYVRLTRGEVLAVKPLGYVTAARAAGVTDARILVQHVLRNLLEPLVVYFTLDVGTVIVTFSTISYVGIGVPVTVPEWGNMVQGYERYLLTYPWTIGSAGLAIFVTVLAFSLLGDGLRDLLDPRSRRILAQPGGPAPMPAGSSGPTSIGDGAEA
ncbi:MAG: ABC transporter permease [Thermoplasmata archaeon]